MESDKSYITTGMMAYARILVHLDTRGGLQEYIITQLKSFLRKQKLDYEGIPYRCRRCHQVGHIYKDCPLLKKNHQDIREHDQAPEIENPAPQVIAAQKTEQIKISNTMEASLAPLQKKKGNNPIRPPSPQLTRSKAAKGDVFSLGMSLPHVASISHHSSSFLSLSSHLPPSILIPSPSSLLALDLIIDSRPPLPPSRTGHLYMTCPLLKPSATFTSCSLSSVPFPSLQTPSPSVNSTPRHTTRSTTKQKEPDAMAGCYPSYPLTQTR